MATITCPECGKTIPYTTKINTKGTTQQGVVYGNTPDGHTLMVTAAGAVVTKCPKGKRK